MADHASRRQAGMTQWRTTGDLAFGVACSDERPTRHDKVRLSVTPVALEQANGRSRGSVDDGALSSDGAALAGAGIRSMGGSDMAWKRETVLEGLHRDRAERIPPC